MPIKRFGTIKLFFLLFDKEKITENRLTYILSEYNKEMEKRLGLRDAK